MFEQGGTSRQVRESVGTVAGFVARQKITGVPALKRIQRYMMCAIGQLRKSRAGLLNGPAGGRIGSRWIVTRCTDRRRLRRWQATRWLLLRSPRSLADQAARNRTSDLIAVCTGAGNLRTRCLTWALTFDMMEKCAIESIAANGDNCVAPFPEKGMSAAHGQCRKFVLACPFDHSPNQKVVGT
jgi:hypothetical protein